MRKRRSWRTGRTSTRCGGAIGGVAAASLFAVSLFAASLFATTPSTAAADELRLGLFRVDVSPPIGSPLAYDPCVEVTDPLWCRGFVLLGAGEPIVVAAFDWIGIANESHRFARKRIADALGTDVERVSVHTLHQHDAPRCDFTAAQLLAHHGVRNAPYDVPWGRDVLEKVATAAADSIESAVPFDAVGVGQAEVEKVASNRRIQDENGQVIATRYTACRDPELRAKPAGTIDPMLRAVSFWNGDEPVAVLTYYATHPQSYYRTGQANPDFPGYARDDREETSGIPHLHFNGAGGNIGAGKWNDGSKENRAVLAGRVAEGMRKAFEATRRTPVDPSDLDWATTRVSLPPGEHLVEEDLVARLKNEDTTTSEKMTAAKHLAWLRGIRAGDTIDVHCLKLGEARLLHLPGELFVEYQLAAAKMRPDRFVAMAAYGEYGPGYIGTEAAYSQGGYETSERASRVAPRSEAILTDAIEEVLEAVER